ncbi:MULTISPECIES: hypothetical protein [Pseudomonas syringae group]|uniref:Uncharacterized protein n=2 Tax=Pseudomonas syringae group TaxID=136849 RepID=A0ABX6H629_9PSED|nr:hypothetical protein [Pseudomonas asturiensis]QHF01000.1 hypothetical protein N015_00690 [Pseudomonas asturiensis]
MTSINDAKKIISALAAEKQITFCEEEWNANYNNNWDEELSKIMKLALEDVEKLCNGVRNNDDVLSSVALTMARIRFMKLSDFFLNIHEDFEKLLLIYKDDWPKIPENYKY